MDTHPIAQYRRARGWTQAQLAAELGVHRNTVAGWENGRRPYPIHVPKLAQAFAIAPVQLQVEIDRWRQAN